MDILSRVNPIVYESCIQLVDRLKPGLGTDINMLEDVIVQLFNRFDKNGNGSVSRGELRTFLFDFYTGNKYRRDEWATAVIQEYDQTGNNNLSFDEVRKMIVDTLRSDNMHDTIDSLQTIVFAPCIHDNSPHTRPILHQRLEPSRTGAPRPCKNCGQS
jgi:hypothetical protein